MESDSDGEGDLEVVYSSMEQPPLIKQLRGILSEYPDNGQIIKELIQNAEDAGASEVKIIYDERVIRSEEDKKNKFKEFFKAPALCVTNNSLFKKKDWKGIKMIASSVKEDDKLKVGRFGLGFKSVFHMTDYPCILSGDTVLLIDPTKPSDQVNAEFKLKNLNKYKGLDTFLAAFESKGIDWKVIEDGNYPGTIFWFPLRDSPSKISSTLYDKQKVTDLFTSFEKDSSETLVFLCHLANISLYIESETGQLSKVAGTEISNKGDSAVQQRLSFKEAVKEAPYPENKPIICSYFLSLRTYNRYSEPEDTKWIVVQYCMGNNSSENLKQLAQDSDLCYTPLAGVATPVESSTSIALEGHVFCFLPLPREESVLTGLPVHVNGFFALSQNRHHLKWSTSDQKGQNITDKSILWNQMMIEECIPAAYEALINHLIRESQQVENPQVYIDTILRSIPSNKSTLDKWAQIPHQLAAYFNEAAFLYCITKCQFVTIHEAKFATFTDIPSTKSHIKQDIVKVIARTNLSYVELEAETYKKLEGYASRKLDDFQPSKFANILRHNRHIFQHLTNPERYSVLSYLLSDGDYNCIDNLPVLPVSSGDWETCNIDCPLFLCDTHMHGAEVDLFPSFRNRLVVQTSEMEQFVWSNLQKIANDRHQLQKMGISAFKSFMMQSLQQEGQSDFLICNQRDLDWLRKIWEYIHKSSFDMKELQNIPLVPEIIEGTWDSVGIVKLHTLTGLLLQKKGISNEISQCFQLLGVTVFPEFPSWFPEAEVSSWLHTCQKLSIERLLNQLWEIPEKREMIKKFNSRASDHNRDTFVEYMCQFADLDHSSQNFLKHLQIFRKGNMFILNNTFTSVNENPNFITVSDVPIKLPKTCIIASSNNIHLLRKLGAIEVDRIAVINMILKAMLREGNYTQEERNIFMLYFLEHFHNFEHSHDIITIARQICFLKTDSGEMRPTELFNPDNRLLHNFFQGEKNKLPIIHSMNERQKAALKKLGLKNMVGVKDVAASAAWVHAQRNNQNTHEICVSKSQAILEVLNKQAGLLNEQFQNSSLKMALTHLCFVYCSQKKPEHFPDSLIWYPERFCKPYEARCRNYENECLVGATVPLIDSSFENLDQKFGWNTSPEKEKVIKQLLLIKDSYIMKEKAIFLPLVKQIYNFMTKNLSSLMLNQDYKIVWTGEKFECPAAIVTTCTSSDIQDLSPYFYRIPPEFAEFTPFFKHVGCNQTQTVSVLLQTLHKIRDKYKDNDISEEIDRDMDIVNKILEKLAERRDECINYDVLLPVQAVNTSYLQFHPASKCTADKNAATYQHDEGDNSIVFVDSRIPPEIAKALGAKPLNKQILSGTESMGIEGFGQNERLTDRINKLITDSYRDGLSVPKELIQNADDAGATVVKFVYDEREHQDARKQLLTPEMADCQGPAILVYNNAVFSKADFDNIKKLSGGTKASDMNKIGKFGLGFCAVYNLTDLPSFVSKFSVVIFDPQKKYLKDTVEDSSPGIKIDFSRRENKKLLRIHKDQFKPYQDLFGCEMDNLSNKPFEGTLFRLPLRTTEQSQSSEISNIAYSRDEVHNLLTMLIENAGNMLLFTQSVEQLELYHIPKHSQITDGGILLFSVTKNCQNKNPSIPGTILQKVSSNLSMQQQFSEQQHLNIDLKLTEHCLSIFPQFKHYNQRTVRVQWLVVWRTGIKESLEMTNRLEQKETVPLSAVAVPTNASFTSPVVIQESGFSFYSSGYLFCFLPLPIETKLPFHVNGSFDVTSDRKGLKTLTDDDKKARKSNWNEYLQIDATVNALFALLEHFTINSESSHYIYYQLWPSDDKTILKPLHESFYNRLVKENKPLFYGQGRWVAFSDVAFLDPKLRRTETGNQLYEMLYQFGLGKKVLIDISEQIVKSLSAQHDIEQNIIKDVECLDIFLLSLQDQYWTTRTNIRNAILIFAIKSGIKEVQERLKNCKCVPVQEHEMLKKPCELVHPEKYAARLFTVKDAVFPSKDLQQKNLLLALSDLGMVGEILPFDMLIDRFSSVRQLAEQGCTQCSLTRCRQLLYYMSRYPTYRTLDQLDLSPLADIHILPVLCRPQDWKFSWFAETDETLIRIKCSSPCSSHVEFKPYSLVLGQPKVLYRQSYKRLAGMVTSIIDEKILKDMFYYSYDQKALHLLHVKDNLPDALIIKQLARLHTEYKSTEYQCQELHNILMESFAELQRRIQTDDLERRQMLLEEIKRLRNKPIILVEKTLHAPEKVVFHLKHNCSPHLVKLPESEGLIRKDLYQAIGIRETYTVENIIEVLKQKKSLWEGKICNEVETIKNILENLESLGQVVPDDCRDYVIAPDARGYLLPICDLALTDDSFESSIQMQVVHSSIPHMLAEKLGAKQKKRKCYEEISIGIPFGQKEKLTSRLKGLLSAYPCDSGIMKELVQNADDAHASEIHFIKDFRIHPADKIFSQSCANLQGPSLCVYNNSYFTEEDLKGIHDLGDGSKANDPTKTGQYGVGFNSVYHITDTPSFMSKDPRKSHEGVLCIFDPLCCHLPGVKHDEPGIQCKVSNVRSNFPDVLSGFLEEFDLFHNNTGTLFRLPLRTKGSAISNNSLSVEELNELLHDMTKDLFEALLFVKNVECIKVSDVSSGQMVQEYCVRLEISDENKMKRQDFFRFLKESVKQANSDRSKLLQIEARDVSYEATITDSNERCESYYIVQRLGFPKNTNIPSAVSEAYKEKTLGCLPLGGIAHKILKAAEVMTRSPNIDKYTGESSASFICKTLGIESRLFCFLPLPGTIPIPVHINGHFALDHESRRGLCKHGKRKTWNESLIKHVITPAYVQGITHWRKMFSHYEAELKNWTNVNDFSQKYHLIFPVYKDVTDDYWRLLTKYLFEMIMVEKHSFFPVCLKQSIIQSKEGKTVFKCKWIPLGQYDVQDLGYFNTLKKLKWEIEYQHSLERILKHLEMNIIHTPSAIQQSIEDSGITNLSVTTPEAIVSFLTTFKTGPCHIGDIDSLLDNTRIQNIKNLRLLLMSITDAKNFKENIEKLPVLLTEDSRLRTFQKEKIVYFSEFCWMFPGSEQLFIQRQMVKFYPMETLLQKGFVCPFSLPTFKALIPDDIRCKLNQNSAVIWNDDLKKEISPRWIVSFWQFLSFIYEKNKSTNENKTTFKEFVKDFNDWAVLPSKGKQFYNHLITVTEGFKLLNDTASSANYSLNKVVTRLELPVLDNEIFYHKNFTLSVCMVGLTTVNTALQVKSLLTSLADPTMFLRCLHAHNLVVEKKQFRQTIELYEAGVILKYFSEAIENERIVLNKDTIEKLMALSLYEAHDGSLIQLLSKAYVIPSNIPTAGFSEFAEKLNVHLLKENRCLAVLYKTLSVQSMQSCELYSKVILPNIRCLPRQFWIKHLTYIKEKELQTSWKNVYDENQKLIIYSLKQLDFIDTETGPKKCDHFLNHKNTVFRLMCTVDQFLPAPFQSDDWTPFIALLGMQLEVTDELIIQFAETVANAGRMNEDVKTKSEVILNCFLERLDDWKDITLKSICSISFVLPKEVCYEYRCIFKRKDFHTELICMKDSVESKYIDICWSTKNVLPFDVDKKYHASLGIESVPPLLAVLKHFQNISTEIACKLDTGIISGVENLMIKMYKYLNKHAEFPLPGIKLEQFPVIHLPAEKKMMSVNSVVLDLNQEQELKPYLYKAPAFYGQFFGLFQKLGTSENVQCFHYLQILEQIYAKTKQNPLTLPELGTVGNVLKQMQDCIRKGNIEYKGKRLYLPDEKKCLFSSTELIVWDNELLKERMRMETSITYFIGFRNICSSIKDPVLFVKELSSAIRPKLLSEIIHEKLNIDRNSIDHRSIAACRMMSFIRSQEFIIGVCRIKKYHSEKFDPEKDVKKIKDLLHRIKILEVSTLETFLEYKGKKVENSNEPCEFFHEEGTKDGEKVINFFFKAISGPVDLGIIDILSSGIATVILEAANISTDASIKLLEIMRKIGNPESISRVLDKEQYPMLEVESQLDGRSAFPKPGTYVEKYFHPFLVMTLDNFEESEYRYVALELEDEEMDVDSDNANSGGIYIYVHIVQRLQDMPDAFSAVHTKYLVDTGSEEYEKIPAYRLFRFVRQVPMSDEIQTYDLNVPQRNLPFDENCRRIRTLLREAWSLPEIERRRIIRRLSFQWHPDKNQGFKDYATRVFHFIQQVLLYLERDEDILDEDTVDGQSAQFAASAYSSMFQRLHRRAQTYVQAYHENLDDYNRCYRTGHYNHIQSSTTVCRDINEARRWMRQAKCDYQAASAFLETEKESKAYNWICYTCHQASEKALKAACYSKNANEVCLQSHSLVQPANCLSFSLIHLAQNLESLLGGHTRMQYPNAVSRPRIPADVFTRDTAEAAIEITHSIIKESEEEIS